MFTFKNARERILPQRNDEPVLRMCIQGEPYMKTPKLKDTQDLKLEKNHALKLTRRGTRSPKQIRYTPHHRKGSAAKP